MITGSRPHLSDALWLAIFILGAGTVGLALGVSLITQLEASPSSDRLWVIVWSVIWLSGLSLACVRFLGLNRDVLGWRPSTLKYLFAGAVVGVVLAPTLGWLASQIRLWVEGATMNPQVDQILLPDGAPAQWVLMGFLVIITVPVVEEILYRGVFFGFVRWASGTGVAILLSSALFGLVHYDIANSIGTGFLGVACAWVRVRSDSIWPAVTTHAAFNAVGFFIMTLHQNPGIT